MAISRFSRSRGFTLLEAIVALAIIGLALVPLVSYIAQAADALERAGDSNARSLAMQSALALMEPVNPIAEPTGQLALDDTTAVSWQSQIVVKPNDGTLVGSGLASFRVGFYNVHVDVTHNGGEAWFGFDMRKVGYDRLASGFPSSGTSPLATPPSP